MLKWLTVVIFRESSSSNTLEDNQIKWDFCLKKFPVCIPSMRDAKCIKDCSLKNIFAKLVLPGVTLVVFLKTVQ